MIEQFIYFLYTVILILFTPIILLILAIRYPVTFFRHFFDGFANRIGKYKNVANLNSKSIWIHAASLGECRAAIPLIYEIKKKYSQTPIVFTSTTINGIKEAQRLQLSNHIYYAPIDFPWILLRAFKLFNPKIIILLESEIWANWLKIAKKLEVPVVIANARISKKSFYRYQQFLILTRILMNKISFICAREEQDYSRFIFLGMNKKKISLTGNLKYDIHPNHLNTDQKNKNTPHALVWVAGSIQEQEAKYILKVFIELRKKFKNLKLIMALRHLDNINEVIFKIKPTQFIYTFQSKIQLNNSIDWDILLWDTFGNLWEAYRQANIVFIGGSLVPKGGQNPIEPAWFEKTIIFGPYMDNFTEPAQLLIKKNGAEQIQNSDELLTKMDLLLSHPEKMKTLGLNAKNALNEFKGQATQKTITILEKFIKTEIHH